MVCKGTAPSPCTSFRYAVACNWTLRRRLSRQFRFLLFVDRQLHFMLYETKISIFTYVSQLHLTADSFTNICADVKQV